VKAGGKFLDRQVVAKGWRSFARYQAAAMKAQLQRDSLRGGVFRVDLG
jgi:hypothetical protein